MANTTKRNVVLIAPELAEFVQNSFQTVMFSVVTVENGTLYTITVDGTVYSYMSGSNVTAEAICGGLADALSGCTLISVVDNLDGTLNLISVDASVSLTYSSCVLLSYTVVKDGATGGDLFDLLLADVILCVKEIAEDHLNDDENIAKLKSSEVSYKEEQERAQRYLMAHLLTVAKAESTLPLATTVWDIVGDVQYRTGANAVPIGPDTSMYQGTKYGEIFYDIWKRHYLRFI